LRVGIDVKNRGPREKLVRDPSRKKRLTSQAGISDEEVQRKVHIKGWQTREGSWKEEIVARSQQKWKRAKTPILAENSRTCSSGEVKGKG